MASIHYRADSIFNGMGYGAKARLSTYRKRAAEHAGKDNPHDKHYTNWRNCRFAKCGSIYSGMGYNTRNGQKIAVFTCWAEEQLPGVAYEWVDSVEGAYIKHTGWFSDSDANETYRGFVLKITRDKWLAGYFCSGNGEYVVFADAVYSSAEDAASEADGQAEYIAEEAREDSERFDAMQDAELEAEEARAKLAKLYPARNISEALREDVRECVDALREARDELKAKTEAYERGEQ